MSITVSDVLRLPSMTGSCVAAGAQGLQNPVESITVLEYGYPTDVLDTLFQSTSFEGNELLLTAFATIHDNVEAQCLNIRRYHAAGSVGIVLFYVGLILPAVDRRLIDCCNELGFTLIVMPQDETGRKYGEVISEVLYAIFQEQKREHYFVSTILDRISGLPQHQRNLDTLLRMLCEHLRSSVVLANRDCDPTSVAYWPRAIEGMLCPQLDALLKNSELRPSMPFGSGMLHIQKCPLLWDSMGNLQLYLLKYGEPLPDDILWQASEVVRLFIHIWNENHGKLVASELIRAIINNEPLEIARLSNLLRIPVSALNQLWLFFPHDARDQRDEAFLRSCSEHFSAAFGTLLVGSCGSVLTVCTSAPPSAAQRGALLDALSDWLQDSASAYTAVCCDCLSGAQALRNAYWSALENWELAAKIYPRKLVLQNADLRFAHQCRKIASDPQALTEYRQLITPIKQVGSELLSTLSTYLLDAESSATKTAQLLFVHLNTVKYRLRLVHDLCGHAPNRLPDSVHLSYGAALARILGDEF